MIWHFYANILMLIATVYFTESKHTVELKFIQNYVQKQRFPSRLLFFSCWDKVSLVKLSKLNFSFITVIRNFSKIKEMKPSSHSLISSDATCRKFDSLMKMAEEMEVLNSPHRWLILAGQSNESPFSGIKLSLRSNFIVASKTPNGLFHLKSFYKYSPHDKDLSCNDVGLFSEKDNSSYNQMHLSKNRSNMMGTNITVSYVVTQPTYPFDVTDYKYCHIDNYSKLSYITTSLLLQMLNFTVIYKQRDSWGYKAPNATHFDRGIFGDLENGTAELAATVSFYTHDRMKVAEFLFLQSPMEVKFMCKSPPLSTVRNLFALPFEGKVWYCLYLVAVVPVFVLYMIVKYEDVKHETTIANIKPKFLDAVMVQIGCVTQQGSDTEPRSNSGRIALLVILLVMMFLYTAYSASIVVLLQSTCDSVKTVDDLLYSKIELGAEDTAYNRFFLANQQESLRREIYERKIAKGETSSFMNIQDGMRKVKNEFFAFHVETTAAYKIVMDEFQEHEKCGLIEVDFLNNFKPTIAIRKKSPFKEIVKVGFSKIHESGITNRHSTRIYAKKPRCTSQRGTFINVGLIDAYFPLLVFCVGVLVSNCVLLIEIIFKRLSVTFLMKLSTNN